MKRKPIILNPSAVALIQVFTKEDFFEDCWIMDTKQPDPYYEKSAKQFINQLADQDCAGFLVALRDAITKRLAKWDKENKRTHWATMSISDIKDRKKW